MNNKYIRQYIYIIDYLLTSVKSQICMEKYLPKDFCNDRIMKEQLYYMYIIIKIKNNNNNNDNFLNNNYNYNYITKKTIAPPYWNSVNRSGQHMLFFLPSW